ncbi:MAG: hypothetical protein JNK78_03880 [Planctomycetes bacterium]|nr:hypothetical protein [Planctomycetota bacterium]
MVSTHVATLMASLFAAAVSAQAPAPPPVDPALPEQLKTLKDMVADPKMLLDFQAIGLMQKLAQGADQKNPKDRERIAKAIGDVFKTGKLRGADKDILYREAGEALAKLGADGGKELQKALTDARFKDALPLQAQLLLALGRTQDERQVDWLLETAVRSPHDEIRAAAGEALGSFTSLDVKVRRDVVKGLLREWGSLHSLATQRDNNDPNAPLDMGPQNARRTLKAVEGKWNDTVKKMTGLSHSTFEDWQRWLNKNPNWTPAGSGK